MTELVFRYAKMAGGFALLWALIALYNNVSCRKVPGNEMEPTLANDTFHRINPNEYKPREHIDYDDVVFYARERPGERRDLFLGRVVGLPGDRIQIQKGDVIRNGQRISQSYVAQKMIALEDWEEIIVPRDCYYVLMDRRKDTAKYDSRKVGPIGQHSIVGKVRP